MLQLYANIKERRRELGMSQDELASKTGYKDRSSIAKIEKGLVDLSRTKIDLFAAALKTTQSELMGWDDTPHRENEDGNTEHRIKGVRIPVLGYVRAGIPVDAVEEILDWEEIHPSMAATGDFFALKIKGDSMEPRITAGDVVIVKEQHDVDSGDIAIVLVNGDDATVKKLMKYENGSIALVAFNSAYAPMVFTPEQIETLPVQVIGKVVELRGKF